MAQIGTFTRTEDGSFTGVIRTLRLNAKARFVPTDKDNDKAPDLRGYAGAVDYAEHGVMRSGGGRGPVFRRT